ncbi:hypothetical protein GCK32_017119 [Trichostrongylus colubriformis]|uniref:7TM GPCR serpentine receptor class x (Srx) domain-containing protein n=1 Tax=Trichostrongylus colubriformis TaxID=6319 RepID=A0AAN8FIM5_TRICO
MTVICFHTISLSASGRLARFYATTLIWGVNHCGAGFIVIAFNRDIRQHILRILRFTDPRSNKVSSIRVAMHSRL